MATAGNNAEVPTVNITEESDAAVSAATVNDMSNELGADATITGTGRATPRIGVKLKMPAAHLAKLTTAIGKLVDLQNARGVEGVVLNNIEDAENKLSRVLVEFERVNPVDDVQREFKAQWYHKHLQPKITYLNNLKKLLRTTTSEVGSRASRVSRAVSKARANEAVLELKRKQMIALQEERDRIEERRRAEEEKRMQDKQQQLDLELELEQAKLYRQTLEEAEDNGSEDLRLQEFDLGLEGDNHGPREPAVSPDWLRTTRQNLATSAARVHAPKPDEPIQDHLLQHVLLSQAKLPIFKGDQLEFLWFRKAFEQQVEAITSDPRRRLYLLLQQLQGEPHTMVKGCQLARDPVQGYNNAMAVLGEKYGNPVQQALAFRNELMTWPLVKGPLELSRFRAQLQLCQQVKSYQGGMSELDSSATLLRLVAKLAPKTQLAWQMKVVDIEGSLFREASFDDFVQFVQRLDKARNHPVFGKLEAGKIEWGNVTAAARIKAFATAEEEIDKEDVNNTEPPAASCQATLASNQTTPPDAFKPPCLFCAADHSANECKTAEERPKKDRLVQLRGLCFSCLRPGHTARTCKARLRCSKCEGLHPTVLHEERRNGNTEQAGDVNGEAAIKKLNLATVKSEQFAVPIAPIKVGKHGVESRAALDSASTATFITRALAHKLKLQISPVSIALTTMTGESTISVGAVYGLLILGLGESSWVTVNIAYVVEDLPFQQTRPLTNEQVSVWPHLANVPFQFSNAEVEMLIGQDVPQALAPMEPAIKGSVVEPFAVKTILGWTIQGPLGQCMVKTPTKAMVHKMQTHEIGQQLQRLYYRDYEDAFDFVSRGLSKEDRQWLQRAAEGANRSTQTGHYTVRLPTRECVDRLKDNYSQAATRMTMLKRQFDKSVKFEQDYRAFMQNMIDKGFVELAPESAGGATNKHYVLHHGVYHPHKPDKIRVVFNCASKYGGLALNDCLISGPDLTSSIVGVLLRFRQGKVAFMADIDAMFYQVFVPADQRDLLRFLWWDADGRLVTYRLKVHLFGATSSPSVANWTLRKAAEEALQAGVEGVSLEAVKCIQRNFYVDDCLKSVQTEEQATKIIRGVRTACKYGGFHLSKFLSTSAEVMKSVDEKDWAKGLKDVYMEDKNNPLAELQERALGVAWNLTNDRFEFKIASSSKPETVTKRTVLSSLSRIYDPLGIAAPIIIVARMFFRELTKSKAIMWDQPLEPDSERQWLKWKEQLPELQKAHVRRNYMSKNEECDWQLHAFCDASKEAYSAVVYLQCEDQISFVFGKARVAPPKAVTIPRLELTAAKLASEVISMVQSELEIPIRRRYCWTDSTTVLDYLKNQQTRYHTFVANRVNAILHLTTVDEWRFVPTKLNPADQGSRGLRAEDLGNSMWLKGADFLRCPQAEWPQLSEEEWMANNAQLEVRATKVQTEANPSVVEQMAERYSTMFKFRRAVAVWLRVKTYLKEKHMRKGIFGVEELQYAEKAALQWLQREHWAEETNKLASTTNATLRRSSPLFKLSPVFVDGLICLQSRTREQLPIVPAGIVGNLLLYEAHEARGHLGRNATAAALQCTHWLIGLSRAVRKLVKNCIYCRNRRTLPMTEKMAVLPEYRSRPANYAFEYTGVDYFGPFRVRNHKTRQMSKVYGALFTCAATRAVHIEIAPDLSGSGFINALRRFISRRGQVRCLISDNGTNFEAANRGLYKELKEELRELKNNSDELVLETRKKAVEWRFNTPGASHHGGFWERLVRTIRRVLHAVMDHTNAHLTLDELTTFMCEAEAIMNNRPITAASDDPNDYEALTPNHLILGQQVPRAPIGSIAMRPTLPRQRWKLVQQISQSFWKRWSAEYLVLLKQTPKWHQRMKQSLTTGDVVLVADPLQPRERWPLGRIIRVHRSQFDNLVRTVDIKTANNVLTRPITKVCLLEAMENRS